jgi:hypothetical protein
VIISIRSMPSDFEYCVENGEYIVQPGPAP